MRHMSLRSLSFVVATAFLSAVLELGPVATARAQNPGFSVGNVAPVVWPYYGYGNYPHSSTLPEGVLRGRAELTRAAGEASLYWAEAEARYQIARRRALENRLRALQIRQERERLGLAHRRAVRELRRAANESRRSGLADAMLPEPSPIRFDTELRASNKLGLGRSLLERGREESAYRWLESLMIEFPDTRAAVEAENLLIALRDRSDVPEGPPQP